MKNIVHIKKLNILEPDWCAPKSLITVNGIDLMVHPMSELKIHEGRSYELFLDITPSTPDYDGYQYFFLENEPIINDLNEYYEFLLNGTISRNDFDILAEGRTGVFESETDEGLDCYKIIGQAQDEYLVSNGIYFYIGKNRGVQSGRFLTVYCVTPYLCNALPK